MFQSTLTGDPVRLIAVLLLTTCLAVLGLTAPAQAHGFDGGHGMSHGMIDCPECPDMGDGPDGAGHMSQDCPHLTGCGAMVLTDLMPALPAVMPYAERHDRPVPAVLDGRYDRINVPPPRLRA